jgi:hypothetical protein
MRTTATTRLSLETLTGPQIKMLDIQALPAAGVPTALTDACQRQLKLGKGHAVQCNETNFLALPPGTFALRRLQAVPVIARASIYTLITGQ